jgi:hypothetical protein
MEKKFKQRSNASFNDGKEIKAMKRLTLHHNVLKHYCFIASVAQLCVLIFLDDKINIIIRLND